MAPSLPHQHEIDVRTARFWVPPVVGLVLAILLAALALTLDSLFTWPTTPPPPLFAGSASTGATLLSTIAGAVTSLLALVFTIITVVIQLATGQYSARALRTLYTDRPSHFTIGIFVATVSYSLLVLPSVSGETDALGVTVLVAVVMAVLSVVTFAIFAHHIAHLIRVGSLVSTVAADTRSAIDRAMPDSTDEGSQARSRPAPPDTQAVRSVRATSSGALVIIDEPALVKAAHKMGGRIDVVPALGDYVPQGAVLFRVWGLDTAEKELRRCVVLDVERRLNGDVMWGMRLLVDVCLRALSPAINDPTTAVQSLDRIHELLRVLATRVMAREAWHDEQGTLRLTTRTPAWEDFVALGVDEVRQVGSTHAAVLRRLRALMIGVRDAAPLERRPALQRRLELLDSAVTENFDHEQDQWLATQPDVQGMGGAGWAR